MPPAADPAAPYCECGNCDATGRAGGPEITLPLGAWAVAGAGDHDRLAVHPDHAAAYDDADHELERHEGWVAVSTKGLP